MLSRFFRLSSLLLVIAVSGCGGGESVQTLVGLDGSALDAMAKRAETDGANCLVVLKGGELVSEWNFGGSSPTAMQEGFSTTKSVASLLIGIAQDQGLLSLDQPASDFISEWKGTKSEPVTIRQLLSMTSGRYYDFQTDYAQMAFFSQDKSGFSIGLEQQHEPGTVWEYNNSATQTLEVVLKRASNMAVNDFAAQYLFNPLGLSSRLITDAAGNAGLYAGMQTSCRDLATLTQLVLDEGAYQGKQIISQAFVAEAITQSSTLKDDYGLLWWLDPSGAYYMSGACGQVAMAMPQFDVVATLMRLTDLSSPQSLLTCGGESSEEILLEGISAASIGG
jgi:CubicO group peptidase (beta-lactamase class C family)